MDSEDVTVGAKPFTTDTDVSQAFGKKVDFGKFGIVPVLVVIENKRKTPLDVRAMKASLVASDGRHGEAVSANELPYLAMKGKQGKQSPVSVGVPVPLPKKKNPLSVAEIEQRAFSAQMIAPGDTASGFVYFEANSEHGDKLYLEGLRDGRSRQELLYFEFPFEAEPQ